MKECNWARIVETADGEHVLFFLQVDEDHDDSSEIHCVTRHEGYDGNMIISGIPDSTIAERFDLFAVTDVATKIRRDVIEGFVAGEGKIKL